MVASVSSTMVTSKLRRTTTRFAPVGAIRYHHGTSPTLATRKVASPQVRSHGPDLFSNLPIDIHVLILEAVIDNNTYGDSYGRSRHQVHALISTSPAVFRAFQLHRPRILRHIFRALTCYYPGKWAVKVLQETAVVVASVSISPENTIMPFSKARQYIRRFDSACKSDLATQQNPHFQPIRLTSTFNPPEDIETLARLIRIVSQIRFSHWPCGFVPNDNLFNGSRDIIAAAVYQLFQILCTLLPTITQPSIKLMSLNEFAVLDFKAWRFMRSPCTTDYGVWREADRTWLIKE